jgi:hypothetical protein
MQSSLESAGKNFSKRRVSVLGIFQSVVLSALALLWPQRGSAESLVERQWSFGVRVDTMAVDTDGAIIAAGSMVGKFAPDGTVLWQGAPGFLQESAVVLDGAGDVYVAGMVSAGSVGDRLFIAKYAGRDGTVMWEQRHPLSTVLKMVAVTLDPQGNVVIAATLGNSYPSYSDFYTAKYDGADGSLIWDRIYNGPGGRDDMPVGIVVDQSGDVFVSGTATQVRDGDYPPTNIHTAKYRGSDGEIIWEQDVLFATCTGIALAPSGDVFMVGSSHRIELGNQSFDNDYYTVKYGGSDGHIVWDQRFESPYMDVPEAMAVDSSGDVFVTGYSANQYGNNAIYTVKYSGVNGGVLWDTVYDGSEGKDADNNDVAYVLALDSSGNVFVAGRSPDIDHLQTGGDYYYAKYSGSNGRLLWQHRISSGYYTSSPIEELKSTPDGGVISRLGSLATTFLHPSDPISEVVHASGDPVDRSGFTIAELQDDLPFVDAAWRTFSIPTIDDLGRVACRARWKSPNGGRTAFLLGDRTSAFETTSQHPFKLKTVSPMDPVQNDAGITAYLAKYSGYGATASDDSIVFLNHVLAREGSSAPGGGLWQSFSNIAVTGSGAASDSTFFLEGHLQHGLAVGDRNDTVLCVAEQTDAFGFNEPALALREGMSLQGLAPSETVRSWKILYSPRHSPGQASALAVGNKPIFIASLSSGRQAILTIEGITPQVLRLIGDPTGSKQLTGSTWTAFDSLATGKESLVLLGTAQTRDGAETTGLFLSDRDAKEWEPSALVGAEIPGLEGVFLKAIDSPVVSPLLSENLSGVAFSAKLSGTGIARENNQAIIWIRTGAEPKVLAQEGSPAAEWTGAIWRDFESIAMPGGGFGPLFRASVTEGSQAPLRRGVWAVDSSGKLRLLFRQGDIIANKTLSAFDCLSAVRGAAGDKRAFNNFGEVTWHATFADGSEAVLRTTIP